MFQMEKVSSQSIEVPIVILFSTKRRPSSGQRRGVAAVEAAVCTGIVVVLTFATLELCSAIYLKEGVTVAAYEAARVGVKRRATKQDAVDQAQEILDARQISGANIIITPADFSALNALEQITIRVRAPVNQNGFFVGNFLSNKWMEGRLVMFREFDE